MNINIFIQVGSGSGCVKKNVPDPEPPHLIYVYRICERGRLQLEWGGERGNPSSERKRMLIKPPSSPLCTPLEILANTLLFLVLLDISIIHRAGANIFTAPARRGIVCLYSLITKPCLYQAQTRHSLPCLYQG